MILLLQVNRHKGYRVNQLLIRLDKEMGAKIAAHMKSKKWKGQAFGEVLIEQYFNDSKAEQPKEPEKVSPPKKESKPGLQWDEIFTDQVIKEITNIRKVKKAPLTERSLITITKDIKQSLSEGFTMDQIMDLWSDKMWRSFKADWMRKESTPKNFVMTTQSPVAQAQYNDNTRDDFNNALQSLKA